MGNVISIEAAEILLKDDMEKVESFLNRTVLGDLGIKLKQNQFDALGSFIFNVGRAAFLKSTLLKKIKAGRPREEITTEFCRWTKDNGVVLRGLIARRKAEAELYCR